MPTWLVTGGAGFIGGNFVLEAVARGARVVNLDALTYAGNLDTLASLEGNPDHVFVHGDIGDAALTARLLAEHRPDAVVNFAAESHVDRSITGSNEFMLTNVAGTNVLFRAAMDSGVGRVLHISTDEVYGSIEEPGHFREGDALEPNSPYSVSKAAADLLARAYGVTYGYPITVTRTANNFGPYH